MSVHEVSPGVFEVRYRDGRQKSKTFNEAKHDGRHKAKRAAEAFDEWQKGQRERGEPVMRRKDSPTLDDFTERWVQNKLNLSPKTDRHYAYLLRTHVLPELGTLRLTDLTLERLEDWQAGRLRSGAGRVAIRQAADLLGTILRRAVAHRYLASNPVEFLERPERHKAKIVPATPAQVELMRSYMLERERLGYATMLSVLGYVGPRPQDVLALEWRHLDGRRLSIEQKVTDGVIVRGTKTGEDKIRVVDVPDPVLADLAAWRLSRGRRGGKAELIFPNRIGDPWTKYQWDAFRRRWFNPAAEAAGWPKPPKDLRHTAASLMLAAGRDSAQIARHLGHSVAQSVDNYQHMMDQQLGKPTRPLEDWIREARAECSDSVRIGRSAGTGGQS